MQEPNGPLDTPHHMPGAAPQAAVLDPLQTLLASEKHKNRWGIGVGVALFFTVTLALGGWLWSATVLATMLLSFKELYHLLLKQRSHAARWLFNLTSIGLVGLATLGKVPFFLPLLMLVTMVLIFSSLFRRPRRSMADIGASLFSILYLSFMMMHYILLRNIDGSVESPGLWFFEQEGFWLVLWTISVIAAGDISGYYAGKLFGKNPLYAELSPKKTREGSLGSLLAGLSVGLAGASLASLAWWDALILSVVLVVVGALGDLAESQIKREAGAKDSGDLLQSHGGLLDRIDSYIFSGAVTYYYVHWIIRKEGLAELLTTNIGSLLQLPS